jgi:hypothetical protein
MHIFVAILAITAINTSTGQPDLTVNPDVMYVVSPDKQKMDEFIQTNPPAIRDALKVIELDSIDPDSILAPATTELAPNN